MSREPAIRSWIVGLTLVRLAYVSFIPVTPQEAYYWYYSRHPAPGYFDHPPLTAYSMWLGTHLFGSTALGVKSMGLIWSLATSVVLYYAVLRARRWRPVTATSPAPEDLQAAVATVALYNLAAFSHVYAVTQMPDTLLMFFWILTVFLFQEILLGGGRRYWILVGASFGLALLSKYTAVALLPALLTALIVSPRGRRALLGPGPYLALGVAALVFSPVVYWNATHDWASFAFQFADRARSVSHLRLDYAGQLLGSQTVLLTPLVAVLFGRTAVRLAREPRRHVAALFFFTTGIFIIGGFALISLRTLVKMNWLLPGYLGLVVAAVLVGQARGWSWRGSWMRAGAAVSVLLIVAAHAVVLIPNFPLGDGNTWAGWKDAGPRIKNELDACGGPDRCFLFSNGYKSASMLKFHVPGQPETYAQNIYGRPALQFDYWPLPAKLRGKDALYVITDRREYRDDLQYVREFFAEVALEATYEYDVFWGQRARRIYVYRARDYRGPPTTGASPGAQLGT